MGRVALLKVAVVAALALTASCSGDVEMPSTGDHAPIVTQPAPLSPQVRDQRGQLIDKSDLTDLGASLSGFQRAWRATYSSVSATTGDQTQVSGAFFVPNDPAPDGGWPVVAIAHGTTGITEGCAPSSESNLRGNAATVAGFLKSGYAVALTDYQGLGDDGKHPYLEPRTAAFNVIDSVRALRALEPSVSARWLAYGVSQGGQASWATAEVNRQYGDGLALVGSVALAPAANITGFAELALHHRLTKEQLPIAPMVIAGLATYDSAIVPADYLRGTALDNLPAITGCGPDADKHRGEIQQADVGPTTQADADTLTEALQRIELPQGPSDVPLLVVNGTKDLTVLPAWTDAAVDRSCALGEKVEHTVVDDLGHNDLFGAPAVSQETTAWIADRFGDLPATPNCP